MCQPARAMLVAVEIPDTSTGVVRYKLVVPSPIWPFMFEPQHLTAPLVSTAHVWLLPAEISVTSASATVAITERERS